MSTKLSDIKRLLVSIHCNAKRVCDDAEPVFIIRIEDGEWSIGVTYEGSVDKFEEEECVTGDLANAVKKLDDIYRNMVSSEDDTQLDKLLDGESICIAGRSYKLVEDFGDEE